MAGVGEASAIVNLIATAATLSKAVIDISCRYKHARKQIQSFGREVGLLGQILDQLRQLLVGDEQIDNGVKALMSQIVSECSVMFSQLHAFNEGLHSSSELTGQQSVSRRGKAKWVFEKTELEYLRARVDSMKINILLMMALQSLHDRKSSGVEDKLREHTESITKLSLQSDLCIKRLRTLEDEGANVEEDMRGNVSSSMSVVTAGSGTAASVQTHSTLESIYRAYGWTIQEDERSAVAKNEPNEKTREDPELMTRLLENLGRHPSISAPINTRRWRSRGLAPLDGEAQSVDDIPGSDFDSLQSTFRETDNSPPWTPLRPL